MATITMKSKFSNSNRLAEPIRRYTNRRCIGCLDWHLQASLLPLLLLLQCARFWAFTQQYRASSRNTPSTLYARSSKTTPKMPNISAFSSNSASSNPTTSTMVVLDVENIRGANAFRISHESLLTRIRLWREDRLSKNRQSSLEPMIWVSDHGMFPSVHHFAHFADNHGLSYNGVNVKMPINFGVAFAGLRTADDVIVDLIQLRCGNEDSANESRNTTIVITADCKLISRCQVARRESSSLSDVIFVEPASLLQQLEVYKLNSHEEEGLFGERFQPSRSIHRPNFDDGRRIDGKTNTMTSFKDSSIAMEQHARFQARFKNKGENATATTSRNKLIDIDEDNDDEEHNSGSEDEISESPDYTAVMAAKLKTEQIRRQMLLSDAFYLARPSKLAGRRSASAVKAIHAKYKNRNISKTQQKRLYKRRFGRQRNEEMSKAAATRKELATKLQMHLEGLVKATDEEDIEMCRSARGESESLLHTLLEWVEEEMLETISLNDGSPYNELDGLPMHVSSGQDEPGNLKSDGSWNPLGSVVRAPLRDSTTQSKLAPLRLVVISDTHGFEGALAKFDQSNEHHSHYLLPQADLLIHCGDFAASGSRKNQRSAARRLDDWLARQTHIPEKVVIKGNHDPDSPPRIVFPRSKALYVRASSTLVVNGVTFAIEPYARRMSLRSIRNQLSHSESPLPFCDVLVTHEPPKGVLDLTYHGFTAGSQFLRNLADNAKHKPRLWLCGHIHEGRGILTKTFSSNADEESDESKSTIVINAANANSGKANRLVSGAVLIDIERSHIDESQTAQNTIQLRQTEENDEVAPENMAGLENMREYVTRPGVRRRKGIPRRQLIK